MSAVGPESDWFEKADQDLEMARRALESGKPFPSQACYHAHQSAEKNLKCYLVAHSVSFNYSHDLTYLLQLCIEQEPDFENMMSTVEIMGRFGTELRYPMEDEDTEEPDIAQAYEMIRLAEEVAALVRKR